MLDDKSQSSISETDSSNFFLRRSFRSLSAMVPVPKDFVPILRPKRNEQDMSPLKLRDSDIDGYLSDGKESKKKKNTIVLYGLSNVTSCSSNKDLPYIEESCLHSNTTYHVLPKKSLSILTLLQKKKKFFYH